jgi:hypothetical protein
MMLKKFIFIVGMGFAGCAAVIGLAQATQLTANSTVQGNTSWQDIKGTSYSFDDKNHDGKVNVGEEVKFTVDMHKTYWGVHDFDALKFWIDDSTGKNLSTNKFVWDFDTTNANATETWYTYTDSKGNLVKVDDSYKPWTGGDQLFNIYYTFDAVGVFDLVASVMCSADLSTLTGISPAKLKKPNADWSKWHEDFHSMKLSKNQWAQGETEKYSLTVVASQVPEPQTYAMLLAGLGLMGFMVRRRKSLES